ncbi:MAG: hypothetical protein JJU37_13985 [Balneolaceae bacterium]|nr:hypothetical protein [Balneolaceae bacterium]
MKIITYSTLLIALLTFTACGNGESSAESSGDTASAEGHGTIEFEGVTYEIEWANCRHSETRWQADTGDIGISMDINQRANVGSEGFNYFMTVNLIEEPRGPVTRSYYNHWLTREVEAVVTDAGISGSAYIHPRQIDQNDVESLKMPIRFNIRC